MTIKQINEAVTQQETTHLFMGKEVREVFSLICFACYCIGGGGWFGVVLPARAAIRFLDLRWNGVDFCEIVCGSEQCRHGGNVVTCYLPHLSEHPDMRESSDPLAQAMEQTLSTFIT